jgi:hypothetical protein
MSSHSGRVDDGKEQSGGKGRDAKGKASHSGERESAPRIAFAHDSFGLSMQDAERLRSCTAIPRNASLAEAKCLSRYSKVMLHMTPVIPQRSGGTCFFVQPVVPERKADPFAALRDDKREGVG